MEVIQDPLQKQAVLDAYMDYFAAYTRRDWDAMAWRFDPDMTMFGTGRDEIGLTGEETRALFQREFRQAPEPMSFAIRTEEVFQIAPGVALVILVMDMGFPTEHGVLQSLGNRTSAVLVFREGRWVLAHAHWSQPDVDTNPGESVPLRQLLEERQRLEAIVAERTEVLSMTNARLVEALVRVKTLKGLLPICAHCKNVRSDQGYWMQIEQFIADHSDASFSHGICPQCRDAMVEDLMRSGLLDE